MGTINANNFGNPCSSKTRPRYPRRRKPINGKRTEMLCASKPRNAKLASINTVDRHTRERLTFEISATAKPKNTNWNEAVSKCLLFLRCHQLVRCKVRESRRTRNQYEPAFKLAFYSLHSSKAGRPDERSCLSRASATTCCPFGDGCPSAV